MVQVKLTVVEEKKEPRPPKAAKPAGTEPARAPGAADPEELPEPRVGIVVFDDRNTPAAGVVYLEAGAKEATYTIPVGGSIRLTNEVPPLVYDREQKAAVPGEWPETEEETRKREMERRGGSHEGIGGKSPEQAAADQKAREAHEREEKAKRDAATRK